MEQCHDDGKRERGGVGIGRNMVPFPNNNLPIEIIADILLRLPVKPLLRLKTVCKSWRSLITTTHFADIHLRHHALSSDRSIVATTGGSSVECMDMDSRGPPLAVVRHQLPIQSPFKQTKIAGSCNGILCIHERHPECGTQVVLLNPFTQEYKVVGYHGGKSNHGWTEFVLGFDSRGNEFKLVHMLRDRNDQVDEYFRKTSVYSLKTNSWRLIEDGHQHQMHGSCALIQNHLMHWVFDSGSKYTYYTYGIACFDVCDETWKSVAHPPFMDNDEEIKSLVWMSISAAVLEECLSLVVKHYGYTKCQYDVWVMKEYGVADSWVKLVHISCGCG